MGDIYYVDGKFLDAADATIPVSDLGIVRGYGVFDYARTYNRQPFRLREHVERMFESAASIELAMPWTVDEIIDIVHEAIARNDHAESDVRMIVTAGDGIDSVTPTGDSRLTLIVKDAEAPPPEAYRTGGKIITVHQPRYLAGVKHLNYIPAVRAMRQAREVSAMEAVYLDDDDNVLEGTGTNIFAFINGTLVTPPLQGVLRGITREVVFELAEGRFPVEERAMSRAELLNAEEAFLSGTSKQIMPVVNVDGTTIGAGVPGEQTQQVMAAFGELTGVALPTG